MRRALGWILIVILTAAAPLRAEDLKLRERAIGLLETANQASAPAVRPAYEQVIKFRVFGPNYPEGEGEITHTWTGGSQRDETRLGDYHLINIRVDDRLIISGSEGPYPPAARYVTKFVPIRLVRFDHEDKIGAIDDSTIRGRKSQCIRFETIFGATVHNNEICVDQELGTIVRFRDDREVVENSEFFEFAGAKVPGRIDVYRNGSQVLEVHQNMAPIDGPVDANVFLPPAGAQIKTRCRQWRRAFGRNMPQPAAGVGVGTVDLMIHGTIAADGRVYNSVIQQSDRDDLNDEALKLVRAWQFTPAMCDGKPTSTEANIVLHFQGR